MDVYAAILLQVMLKMKARQFVVQVVHHRANTSSRLWIRTHHITAVYITPQTQNNFNFHYFIIVHSYFILLFKSKTMLIEIYFFLILWSESDTFNYNLFLYQKHHPDDGQITGKNMLVKIL
jgi:hypothetical protein